MLDKDGKFVTPSLTSFDFLTRPLILQISRWDNLKGFKELLQAFILLKNKKEESIPDEDKEFISKMGLVLVGPDPRGVSDDPEATQVLNDLIELYKNTDLKDYIAIVVLNIENRTENHLAINAL